jgi:hypothetical protein
MAYKFDKELQVGKFEIKIDTQAGYGCFEHDVHGEDLGGGLWFECNRLYDYDGVYSLPEEVIEGIEKLGLDADYAK